VAVPETAIYEYGFVNLSENKVGRTRNIFGMQSIAIAQGVYVAANNELRAGIF
jgi:hypothetical protein